MDDKMAIKIIKNICIDAVAETLVSKGYTIADSLGIRTQTLVDREIGLLKERPSTFHGFNLCNSKIGFYSKSRANYVGNLEVGRKSKKWTLDVYGQNNLSELTQLAEELSDIYGTSIKVKLDTKKPQYETYDSELSRW
jgi:hypothetical protein